MLNSERSKNIIKLNEILTYKEICQEFNDTLYTRGKQREQQLNRWNKQAEVEKVGRGKYIIKRELSTEEIQEKEYASNYSQFLQCMLLKLFSKQDSIICTYTYRQLREYLNMVNRHYFPVKYGKENISLKSDCLINIEDVVEEEDNYNLVIQEKKWFNIADSHDKDALHYAINSLKNKGLIVDYQMTYMFYKAGKDEYGNTIYTRPTIATEEQRAEIHQRNMEFFKKALTKKQIDAINEECKKEIGGEIKIIGRYKQAVFKKGEEARKAYGEIPRQYAKEIGYTGYAKAITITKPTRLENLVDVFAPKFNALQVKRYLESKRFDEIPFSIREQLTNKLIKK